MRSVRVWLEVDPGHVVAGPVVSDSRALCSAEQVEQLGPAHAVTSSTNKNEPSISSQWSGYSSTVAAILRTDFASSGIRCAATRSGWLNRFALTRPPPGKCEPR